MMPSRSNRVFLALVGLMALALPTAQAGKGKSGVVTLKIANLTPDTPKKQVRKLEKTVKKVKGVTRVGVSKKKGEMIVRHKVSATLDAIKQAVAAAGFSVAPPKTDGAEAPSAEAPAAEAPAAEAPAAEAPAAEAPAAEAPAAEAPAAEAPAAEAPAAEAPAAEAPAAEAPAAEQPVDGE